MKNEELHADDINDIAIQSTSTGFKVATCDDTGSTLVHDINILTGEDDTKSMQISKMQRLQGKHDNICYRAMFSKVNQTGDDRGFQLYTTGFDYKICLWNLTNYKKTQHTNFQEVMINVLGENAMSYNPPYCYSIDSYVGKGQERLVMGLGNGHLVTFKRTGLVIEEIHGDIHRA